MQTEKSIMALATIFLGMTLIDYITIRLESRAENFLLGKFYSLIGFIITIIFGVAVVYMLRSV